MSQESNKVKLTRVSSAPLPKLFHPAVENVNLSQPYVRDDLAISTISSPSHHVNTSKGEASSAFSSKKEKEKEKEEEIQEPVKKVPSFLSYSNYYACIYTEEVKATFSTPQQKIAETISQEMKEIENLFITLKTETNQFAELTEENIKQAIENYEAFSDRLTSYLSQLNQYLDSLKLPENNVFFKQLKQFVQQINIRYENENKFYQAQKEILALFNGINSTSIPHPEPVAIGQVFIKLQRYLSTYLSINLNTENILSQTKDYAERRKILLAALKEKQCLLLNIAQSLNDLAAAIRLLKNFHSHISTTEFETLLTELKTYWQNQSQLVKRQLYLKQTFSLKEVCLAAARDDKDPSKNSAFSMDLGDEPYLPANKFTAPKIRQSNDVSDDRNQLDGRGRALGMRHLPEKFDPQHRGWRNGYNDHLVILWDQWKNLKQEPRSIHAWADETKQRTTGKGTGSIKYFSAKQRYQYLLNTHATDKTLIYQYNGQNKVVPDSSTLVNRAGDGRPCNYLFVMDLQGNLFVGPEGVLDSNRTDVRLQHPSFIGGDRIICGGEITISQGKITRISNESGHYLPGPFSLYRVVCELEKRGVLANDVKIGVRLASNDKRFEIATDERGRPLDLTFTDFKQCVDNALKDIFVVDSQDKKIVGATLESLWDKTALARRDLSEKANPYAKKFIAEEVLQNINQYLTKRCKETHKTKFFGYSAKDYYARRDNWIEILTVLGSESPNKTQILTLLDNAIDKFTCKIARHEYADVLSVLREQISQLDAENLRGALPTEKINQDLQIYCQQQRLTANVKAQIDCFITRAAREQKDQRLLHLNRTLFNYGVCIGKNETKEFLTAEELKIQEYKNMR